MRRERPKLTFPEITKLLGAQWSKQPQEEKQVRYNGQAGTSLT